MLNRAMRPRICIIPDLYVNVDRLANAGVNSLIKCAAGIDAQTEYRLNADRKDSLKK